MKAATYVSITTLTIICASSAQAATFGSGANKFDIEFVSIGDPGNPDDLTGSPSPVGSVDYVYEIGKYEISRGMIAKANAAGGLDITMDPMNFVAGGPRDDMPATGLSWFDMARFVNWLNTNKGRPPAYKFDAGEFRLWNEGDAGYNVANPFRNSLARYVLPDTDEWYKAAYYDPDAGVYVDYPTGSDIAPTAVASGTAAETAVYNQTDSQGPADITLAGGLSPYGTMGQGGNVAEFEETEYDLANDDRFAFRGVRGSAWSFDAADMLASFRGNGSVDGNTLFGFRVARVPEPSAAWMGVMAAAGLFIIEMQAKKRRREGVFHACSARVSVR